MLNVVRNNYSTGLKCKCSLQLRYIRLCTIHSEGFVPADCTWCGIAQNSDIYITFRGFTFVDEWNGIRRWKPLLSVVSDRRRHLDHPSLPSPRWRYIEGVRWSQYSYYMGLRVWVRKTQSHVLVLICRHDCMNKTIKESLIRILLEGAKKNYICKDPRQLIV